MDDCNNGKKFYRVSCKTVQIPLWTIVTINQLTGCQRYGTSSDSSMDDCNYMNVLYFHNLFLCSDSSMDDCNKAPSPATSVSTSSDSSMDDCNPTWARWMGVFIPVQIPLWTIVTTFKAFIALPISQFRFLYGRL